jgi:hypothetical protein
MISQGRCPHLMIDLHNDDSGKLHISRPNTNLAGYLSRMETLEAMLRRHTWFTEGSARSSSRTVWTIGLGLADRFGITACVLELNANWIAGLSDYPSAKNWEQFGAQLCEAFYHYFGSPGVREAP